MIDYIIVGAGLAGVVIAERIATQLNKKVLIIEKRNHIGGNCHDTSQQSPVSTVSFKSPCKRAIKSKVYFF